MLRLTHDYSLLWAKIKESKLTQTELADSLGISRTSFSRKLNHHVDFKQNEIWLISKKLDIKKEDIPKYFFT